MLSSWTQADCASPISVSLPAPLGPTTKINRPGPIAPGPTFDLAGMPLTPAGTLRVGAVRCEELALSKSLSHHVRKTACLSSRGRCCLSWRPGEHFLRRADRPFDRAAPPKKQANSPQAWP